MRSNRKQIMQLRRVPTPLRRDCLVQAYLKAGTESLMFTGVHQHAQPDKSHIHTKRAQTVQGSNFLQKFNCYMVCLLSYKM